MMQEFLAVCYSMNKNSSIIVPGVKNMNIEYHTRPVMIFIRSFVRSIDHFRIDTY
jgi:hypothetical protein